MINTEKGKITIGGIVFDKSTNHSIFIDTNKNIETPFSLINENENQNEYMLKEESFNYAIVFKNEKLSYITIEKTIGDKDWTSYTLSKSNRIAENKDLLLDLGLKENNSFEWGDVSYQYDPRNLMPYILIDFSKKQNESLLGIKEPQQ